MSGTPWLIQLWQKFIKYCHIVHLWGILCTDFPSFKQESCAFAINSYTEWKNTFLTNFILFLISMFFVSLQEWRIKDPRPLPLGFHQHFIIIYFLAAFMNNRLTERFHFYQIGRVTDCISLNRIHDCFCCAQCKILYVPMFNSLTLSLSFSLIYLSNLQSAFKLSSIL